MSEIIGPVLPPDKASKKDVANEDSEYGGDLYGPRLPPKRPDDSHKHSSDSSHGVIGPTLPPEILASLNTNDNSDAESDESDDIIGPKLPICLSSEESAYDVCKAFEKRADKMKQKLTGKPDSVQLEREEWMTVLPPEMSKNFGLGPRSFQKQVPQKVGDRSGWTETPSTSSESKQKNESKLKRAKDDEKFRKMKQEKYDDEMKKVAEKHNKKSKRKESLYDIHTKDRKRKKEKESSSQPRRPFDRDQDLKVNAMDNVKRAAIVKKSKMLNANFAHGEGKYL